MKQSAVIIDNKSLGNVVSDGNVVNRNINRQQVVDDRQMKKPPEPDNGSHAGLNMEGSQ